MIVAECNAIRNVNIWIDAIPVFNATQTAVEIEYQLVVNRVGHKVARTTVDEGVVKRALKTSKDPIVAAAVSEYGWLGKNCPEFDELMTPLVLKEAIKKTKKSSGRLRI